MQLTPRNSSTVSVPNTMNYFRLGRRQYLTRPSGYERPPVNGDIRVENEASLAICIWVKEAQSIDAECLRAWRANFLDADDVFDPAFLQEVIFGGSANIHLADDTTHLFKTWKTRQVSFVPDMNQTSGPCYVHKNQVYTV